MHMCNPHHQQNPNIETYLQEPTSVSLSVNWEHFQISASGLLQSVRRPRDVMCFLSMTIDQQLSDRNFSKVYFSWLTYAFSELCKMIFLQTITIMF